MAKILTVCPRERSKLNGEMGGVQGRKRLRPCVGRGRRQRCPVYFRIGGKESQAFISSDLASPLAPGTFLGPESWEG